MRLGTFCVLLSLAVALLGASPVLVHAEQTHAEDQLCLDMDVIQMQLDSLADDLPADADNDGVPDGFAIALLEFGACDSRETRSSLVLATRTAYNLNLLALEEELRRNDAKAKQLILGQYAEAIAALAVISADMQDTLRFVTPDLDAVLLVAVTCEDGLCMPQPIENLSLAQAFEEFSPRAKALAEPYSGSGDYDEDRINNADEYAAVRASGGGEVEFIEIAAGLIENEGDGDAEGQSDGVGEGNGDDGGGCSAGANRPPMVPPQSGDLSLLIVVVSGLFFAATRTSFEDRARSRIMG